MCFGHVGAISLQACGDAGGSISSCFFIMFFPYMVRYAPASHSAVALGVAAALASLTSSSIAKDLAEPLETIVVTANRLPTRINDALVEVSVIDSERLSLAAGRSLADVLADLPGVQFASNGGLGKSGSVYVRGGESRHTLLLIDGVRYGSATLGQPTLSNLPIEQIERIEVVRGPLSALYGSDAAAGVIQVFTKRGKDEGVHPALSATYGSDDYWRGQLSVSGKAGEWDYSAGAQTQATHGFSATNERAPFGNFNPDRDGFDQLSARFSVGYQFQPDLRFEANGLQSKGRSNFDDGIDPVRPDLNARTKLFSEVLGARVSAQLQPGWTIIGSVGRSVDVDEVDRAVNDYMIGRFETTQTQYSLESRTQVTLGRVLVQAEQVQQAVDVAGMSYAQNKRTIDALGVGWVGQRQGHNWQINLRRDQNSQFGGENTGVVGYGYQVLPSLRLGGTVGSSFVAPSFNDLYYPGYGTPGLLPERGVNKEISLNFDGEQSDWRLGVFDNRIRGFIESTMTSVSNIPRAHLRGLTVSGSSTVALPLGSLVGHWSYDSLDATANTGKKLALRADQSVSARLDWQLDRHAYFVAVRANDGVFSESANLDSKRLPGYAVWNVGAQWKVRKNWQVSMRIDNLSDKPLQNAMGYNQPRRKAYLTVSFEPEV